jgi:hypothetical protein
MMGAITGTRCTGSQINPSFGDVMLNLQCAGAQTAVTMVANKVVIRHIYFVTPNGDNFWHQLVVGLCDLVPLPGSPHRIAYRTERHASVDRCTTLGLRFD